jgi:hypothetical protein
MGAVAITQGEALIEIVGDTPAGALAATIQDGERHRPFDFYENDRNATRSVRVRLQYVARVLE